MRILSRCLSLIIVIIVLASCNFNATATPEPTSAVLFVTPTPSIEATITTTTSTTIPTSTVTPSITPTPTDTPTITPTPNLTPHAIIDSPGGVLNVRSGPGEIYDPPLGSYDSGAMVDIFGRQIDSNGELWWLIAFASGPNGQGWVYADYTIANNIDALPWVNAPPTPTPFIPTPAPTTIPQAVVNSPDGFVQVKRGPGDIYDPPWGAYNNGATVPIMGRQYDSTGELWWLIPFNSSPTGQGWIASRYTIPSNAEGVPWVNVPVPSVVPIGTPIYGTPISPNPIGTPIYSTPTGPTNGFVDWTIAGRIFDSFSGQPVAGVTVMIQLGGVQQLSTQTKINGEFSIVGQAQDFGDLLVRLSAAGYQDSTFTAGPISPRTYYFDNLQLTPLNQNSPLVVWTLFGRVSDVVSGELIPNAEIKAVLGADGVIVETTTSDIGDFIITGQARDAGVLELTITGAGYQPKVLTVNQTQQDSRQYNIPDIQLQPNQAECRYENVTNLTEDWAVARLRTLGFTEVATQPEPTTNTELVNKVVSQLPDPPTNPNDTAPLACDMPVILGIGTN